MRTTLVSTSFSEFPVLLNISITTNNNNNITKSLRFLALFPLNPNPFLKSKIQRKDSQQILEIDKIILIFFRLKLQGEFPSLDISS